MASRPLAFVLGYVISSMHYLKVHLDHRLDALSIFVLSYFCLPQFGTTVVLNT